MSSYFEESDIFSNLSAADLKWETDNITWLCCSLDKLSTHNSVSKQYNLVLTKGRVCCVAGKVWHHAGHVSHTQGHHLCGKRGNVWDFWQLSVKCQEVGEEILSGKSGLKLFVVSSIFASILDFAEFVHFFHFGFGFIAFLPPPLTITLVPAWYE